ncbi:MAG: tetratricopeptide repeat protein [Chloroflexi bacterium]|nr:tetratricopeptide repeat protein [Chloroflexota bacterium]
MYPVMEDKGKLRREQSRRAISLALQNRWDEAAALNRKILGLFPEDVDTYNRLGKALMELGRYREAREAYAKALEISPSNDIARKNIQRLSQLREAEPTKEAKVDLRFFLEESGKASVAPICNPAPAEVLAQVSPGDPLRLRPKKGRLEVLTAPGQYLGEVEPKLSVRLLNLMKGGNRYAAASAGCGENGLKVIIKEMYQHPSQSGRPSFPPRIEETTRPYLRDIVRRYELEESEIHDPASPSHQWGEAEATYAGIASLSEEEQMEEETQRSEEEEGELE